MNRYLASYYLLESQLRDVRKALEEVEHLCQHEIRSLTEQSKSLNTHDAELQLGDEYHYFDVSLRRIINGTALVAIMAYFEDYIKRTSNMFARKNNLDTLDTQGFESVRDKLKAFLKQSNFPFSLGGSDWNMIFMYWMIRNSIVHAGSKYGLLKEKVQELIDSDPCFHVDRVDSTDDHGAIITKPGHFYIVNHKCLDDLIITILPFSKRYALDIYQHDLSYSAAKTSITPHAKLYIISVKDQVLRLIIRCLRHCISK